jgi:hypothetical protein
MQAGAALGLGWMGREDGHKQHLAEGSRYPIGRHTIGGYLPHGSPDRLRAWPAGIAQVALAQNPQALELFREVDQAEEVRESAEQVARLLDREILDDLLELTLGSRIVRDAQAFCEGPYTLFEVEGRRT